MSEPDAMSVANIMQAPTARQVAAIVAETATIGAARNALQAAGWDSRVAGNRITVADRVFARFIDEILGSPRWVVYGIGELPAIWIVEVNSSTDVNV